MKKACFFDRDGIINEMVYEKELGLVRTPIHPRDITIRPGIKEVLMHTHNLGYLNIIISNQPGVALDRITLETHKAIENEIYVQLGPEKVIDAAYYCLHFPFAKIEAYRKKCECRKPGIGMFEQAKKEHDIDLHQSWMIGDGAYDIVSGNKAGCKTIWVSNVLESGYVEMIEKELGTIRPTAMVKKIKDISTIIT